MDNQNHANNVLSKIKQRRILDMVMANPDVPYYTVATVQRIGWKTAKKYVLKFKAELAQAEQQITQELIKPPENTKKKRKFWDIFTDSIFGKVFKGIYGKETGSGDPAAEPKHGSS